MSEDPLRTFISNFLSRPNDVRSSSSEAGYALSSTIGRVRSENQDVALVTLVRFSGQPNKDFDVSVICDGMGGMKEGRQAAIVAASAFVSKLIRSVKTAASQRMFEAISVANHRVYELYEGSGGCTLSAVLLSSESLSVCGHVGDSRIYAFVGGQVSQVSKDDNFDAFRRNKQDESGRDSRLLQYIGMGSDLLPHVDSLPISDREYLLTSDGAHNITSDMLQRVSKFAKTRVERVRNLILISEMVGGLDNASAIATPSKITEEYQSLAPGISIRIITPHAEINFVSFDLVDSMQTAQGRIARKLDNPKDTKRKAVKLFVGKKKPQRKAFSSNLNQENEQKKDEQPTLNMDFPTQGESK